MGPGPRWATAWPPSATAAGCCAPGVEDVADNETRFVWLARTGTPPGPPGAARPPIGPWKTAIVFWGVGSEAPGWLVACLSELAERDVNLTRIESRPRKQGLGRYMFFLDLEGADTEPHVRRGSRRRWRRGSRCCASWDRFQPVNARNTAGLRDGRSLHCRASHGHDRPSASWVRAALRAPAART